MIITKLHEKIDILKKEQELELVKKYNVILNNAKKSKEAFISVYPSLSVFMVLFSLFISFVLAIGLTIFLNFDIFSSFTTYISIFFAPMCLTGVLVSVIRIKNKKVIKFIKENKENFVDSFFEDQVAPLELLKDYKEWYGSDALKALLYSKKDKKIKIYDLKNKVNIGKYKEDYKNFNKINQIVDQI